MIQKCAQAHIPKTLDFKRENKKKISYFAFFIKWKMQYHYVIECCHIQNKLISICVAIHKNNISETPFWIMKKKQQKKRWQNAILVQLDLQCKCRAR